MSTLILLTPDLGGFLPRAIKLIEDTYRENHNTPVHLLAHSYGPVFAQYLLTNTPQAWKNKFIHGFTPIAGDWPGQGATYTFLFTGFNHSVLSYPTDPENAVSSTRMHESHPSTYILAADPGTFGDQEVVIRSAAAEADYTPADFPQLFHDAGLTLAEQIGDYYIGFTEFKPPHYPYVDVYAESGAGLPTVVGTVLPDLTVGQVLGDEPVHFYRDGDGDEEDIVADSLAVWTGMPCYRFDQHVTPDVHHVFLIFEPVIIDRLLANLQRPRSRCW